MGAQNAHFPRIAASHHNHNKTTDFENMNLSATADASGRSLFSATSGTNGNHSGDETLTNISQSTLNFILDEKQQQQQQQENRANSNSVTVNPAAVPATTKPHVVTPATPIITPATPITAPATPDLMTAAKQATVLPAPIVKAAQLKSGQTAAIATKADVVDSVVAGVGGGDMKRTDDAFVKLNDNDDANDDDTSVIELSSDDGI